MRFLFVSAQLPGHLDWGGYLKTAVALASAGHQVLWVSGEEVKSYVSSAGIAFQQVTQTGWRWPPPPPLDSSAGNESIQLAPEELTTLRAERALDQWLDVDRVSAAVDELHPLASQFAPDVVVAENFMSSAAIMAEQLNVPFVVAGWPAADINVTPANQLVVELGRNRLNQLLHRFSVPGRNWTGSGPAALRSSHLHISYWSASWYTGIELGKQTVHVGGQAQSVDLDRVDSATLDATSAALLNKEEITELPWVFITLGTSFTDDVNFFIAASHAAEALGAIPILALGGRPDRQTMAQLNAKAARSSVLVERVNFDYILPMVGASIHHGGAGTTHAMVTHAVPQIVVPHAADQMHQAHGVSRSGVGVGIRPQHVSVEALAQILEEMLVEDSGFQLNARSIQNEFAGLGGVEKAATLLTQIT